MATLRCRRHPYRALRAGAPAGSLTVGSVCRADGCRGAPVASTHDRLPLQLDDRALHRPAPSATFHCDGPRVTHRPAVRRPARSRRAHRRTLARRPCTRFTSSSAPRWTVLHAGAHRRQRRPAGQSAPRSQPRARRGPVTWSAIQLRAFLYIASHLRLYPALHLAASTGMRRGGIAGLRWGDWDQADIGSRSPASARVVAGRSIEFALKTRASRRCVDLDTTTEAVLTRWRQPPRTRRPSIRAGDPMFTNKAGRPLNAESISQLFDRHVARTGPPGSGSTTFATPMPVCSSRPATDQGRERAARPCPPRLHHGHLPTPPPGHERRRRGPLRRADRHRRQPHAGRRLPATGPRDTQGTRRDIAGR